MSRLPRLWSGDRVGDAVLIPVLGIAQAVAMGIGAFATRDAFTALHGGGPPTDGTLATLILAGLATAGFALLAGIRSEALGQSVAREMRVVLYDHLAGMSRRDVEARRLGALSLRFVGDLSAVRLWYGRGLPRVASALVVLPGAGLVLWLLEPQIAGAAIPPVALSLVVMLVAAVGLQARHRRLRSRRAGISIAMMERIAVSPELDLMGRTGFELKRLEEDGATLRRNAVSRRWQQEALRMIPQGGAAVAGAAVLWMAGMQQIAPGTAAAGLSVLAILILPLRELADAWDQYCAWRIAREKALNLLAKPSVRRSARHRGHPVRLRATGMLEGRPLDVEIVAGTAARMARRAGVAHLAAAFAGLDPDPALHIRYDGRTTLPRVAHIGDRPVVLQGTLHRALTLGLAPRPGRKETAKVARAFGLAPLLKRTGGLKGKVAEAGRDVTVAESLRLDLARAMLAEPDVVVIDSARFDADPERGALLTRLRARTEATVLVVGPAAEGFVFDREIDLKLNEATPSPAVADSAAASF
ncbi:ABC transporter ATP-binding protein [Pontivivens ytuae]|uniref:ABC transporter ATP-binding protein n=1 Tax=Pontivivens ytuae TaxID=2789856 RepID=A0A7S9LV08_9RHOB|nr:ABC transporter ATP-binding protein [Pontivivens ytuae]QPH55495.1 ABC transporter ATP-binding protein [Pontivivens ytuae]